MYKRFATHVVQPFMEAFVELQDDNAQVPISLGQRIWKVIPKVPGANRQSQLRDLEMPNEHRKVLARAYARVLDEEASRTMVKCQHAFLKSRSISNANIALGEGYYSATDKQILRYWLLLDCTKGYNYLSWSWLTRVLTSAGLPTPLLRAVQRLVQDGNSVILLFRNHTCAPLSFNSGLAQGCPLSCVLYVLAVDPFLEYVCGIRGVGIVVGFCDDWNVECLCAASLVAVQLAGEEFELCSGQQFNRSKSKILPTRALSMQEVAEATQRWPGCPVVSRAKVLGLWYGYDYRPAEIGQEQEAKYYSRMNLLRAIPSSFAARIILLNVFLRSLWSYVNRHLLIPVPQRKRIEGHDSNFLSKIPYFALGLLSHVSQLYGLRVHLQDFELVNIAGLISTAWLVERSPTPAAQVLRENAVDNVRRGWLRPTYAFATAYGFYKHTVGETVAATLNDVEAINGGHLPGGVFSIVYKKLLIADRRHWQSYWERRVQQRGLDSDVVRRSLARFGSQVSQAERWSCLRLHLNAVPTDDRLRFLGHVDGDHACYFCGGGRDSPDHWFDECPVVRRFKEKLADHGEDLLAWNYRHHCLEITSANTALPSLVRFNDVVLALRRLSKSYSFGGVENMINHALLLYRCPGLRGGASTSEKMRHRSRRLTQPSVRAGYVLYRVDGFSSVQNGLTKQAGCGMVRVEPVGGRTNGQPTIQVWTYLGVGVTNNQAGYQAVLAALEHATGAGTENVCIQTGNTLVSKQATCAWSCRSRELQPLLSALWGHVRALEGQDRHIIIEHVHKQHNKRAAALARHAARTCSSTPWMQGLPADFD